MAVAPFVNQQERAAAFFHLGISSGHSEHHHLDAKEVQEKSNFIELKTYSYLQPVIC